MERIKHSLTTWWGLWIIFFVYTCAMALIIQIFLPHILPNIFWAHGLFVPDSTGFHQIGARKALEIAQNGWTAWELRPNQQYPAGITSIFYYIWTPEPYAMIPFNAVLHATSGCLLYLLLSSFIRNRVAAAGGAALFVFNPAALEWTSQIHRDGTFILGNILLLTSWILLIKAVANKKWLHLIYAASLSILGSLSIWASRPYWNQVAIAGSLILLAIIFIYWLFNLSAKKVSPSWFMAMAVTALLMILIQYLFQDSGFSPGIESQISAAKQEESLQTEMENQVSIEEQVKLLQLIMAKNLQREKDVKTFHIERIDPGSTDKNVKMEKDESRSQIERIDPGSMDKVVKKRVKGTKVKRQIERIDYGPIEELRTSLMQRQKRLEDFNSQIPSFLHDDVLENTRIQAKKNEVTVIFNAQDISPDFLNEYLQSLFRWQAQLNRWYLVMKLQRDQYNMWNKNPYIPQLIENKFYGAWKYRIGSAGSGGNTLIDQKVMLNSSKAFLSYLPRALEIAFFSPFPSEWFTKGSTQATTLGKKIIPGIMVFFYFCVVFFILSLWVYRRSIEFWIISFYCIFGMVVFTYSYANIGTLSRFRYGFFMVILGIGVSLLIQILLKKAGLPHKGPPS